MKLTAADVMVNTLVDWGVEVIFGLPGDGINGVMEALRKQKDKIRFIQVRHEEAAAFMACGYAKFTGKLGVCLATSGPGGIHLLNGLYDAKMDGQPVLAITGSHYHDLTNTFAQQDVELDKLYMDVAGYNARVMGPAHVENVTSLACRYALCNSSVSHITFPIDFQQKEMDKAYSSVRNVPGHISNTFTNIAAVPKDDDLLKAAEILNNGKKIAILAGRGALNSTDELESIAEKLGAPIIKALLGKAAVPDDSPYTTGGIGLLGTKPSQEAIEQCDTLLIIGSSFPYIEFYPQPGQARAVQIDINPLRIGLRYPVDVGLVGDSKKTLQRIIPLLKRNTDRSFLEDIQELVEDWTELMEDRSTRRDKPMKPQVVASSLGKLLNNNAIITCDSGTVTIWYARQITIKRGQMCSVSGNLASMGCGIPYAIAAQIAYPERQVVAFVGDGGFSMLMAELATIAKYKLPIKIVVVKNNSLGQIRWEQMVFDGNPEYGVELQPIDFAAVARGFGIKGYTIDEPKKCSSMLEEALKSHEPAVIEAIVDPYEPPMPAKVSFRQAKQFAKSLAKGEPNRSKIALTVAADRVKEMI